MASLALRSLDGPFIGVGGRCGLVSQTFWDIYFFLYYKYLYWFCFYSCYSFLVRQLGLNRKRKMPSIELSPLPPPTLQPVRWDDENERQHPLRKSTSHRSVPDIAAGVQVYDEELGGGLRVTETASRADYTFPEVSFIFLIYNSLDSLFFSSLYLLGILFDLLFLCPTFISILSSSDFPHHISLPSRRKKKSNTLHREEREHGWSYVGVSSSSRGRLG